MATLRIGPSLADFPAFPDPTTVNPLELGLTATDTTFSFSINGYDFLFTGDFSALAVLSPLELLGALASPQSPNIQLDAVEVRETATGEFAIGFDGASAVLPAAFFFSTLLDPRNFTDDIITAFFGSVDAFQTLDLSTFTEPVVLARPNGPITGPGGSIGVNAFASETDGFSFATVVGGAEGDRIGASDQGTHLLGRDGNDVLISGSGPDWLSGGLGNDTLVGDNRDQVWGGQDNDVLVSLGASTLVGGAGADTFVVEERSATETVIRDFQPLEGDAIGVRGLLGWVSAIFSRQVEGNDLILSNPKGATIRLEDAADLTTRDLITALSFETEDVLLPRFSNGLILGSPKNEVLVGLSGSERIRGGAGDDFVYGNDGSDWITGNRGNDVLWGGDGRDLIFGGNGDDLIDGGAGNDQLHGGRGVNTLTGGDGRDRFVFSQFDDAPDRITDFEVGLDQIDLSAFFRGQAPESLSDVLISESPGGPTELTRFVSLDLDGPGGDPGVRLFQIDDVPDASLLNPGTYIF